MGFWSVVGLHSTAMVHTYYDVSSLANITVCIYLLLAATDAVAAGPQQQREQEEEDEQEEPV